MGAKHILKWNLLDSKKTISHLNFLLSIIYYLLFYSFSFLSTKFIVSKLGKKRFFQKKKPFFSPGSGVPARLHTN